MTCRGCGYRNHAKAKVCAICAENLTPAPAEENGFVASNRCPYCGAPYGIAFGGCRDGCAGMREHQRLIREALDDEGGRDGEAD